MARRRFRYDPEQGKMVELVERSEAESHFIRGEITAFVSPIDGTVIDSRAKYEDHCARHNVVPMEAVRGAEKERDRYSDARQERAFRELLWEKVDKAVRGRPIR